MKYVGRPAKRSLVLVTGATGYIGGRLIPRLLDQGYLVRVLIRGDAKRLDVRDWKDQVDIALGDVLVPDTLTAAFQDVNYAFYLIHSMGGQSEFSERDIQAAENFAAAAESAGVEQIIYLGGLGDPESNLSKHLQSRQQTGDTLRHFNVPVTEFRAGMVVGSGSLSFEMVRNLTERIPVMIAPRWVYTKTQPIAVRDVLNYLVAALQTPESRGKIIEIGTPDILTYAEMMLIYARVRGLHRLIIRVPVLTPRLSSYWVHWMTPVSAGLATPLIEGLRNELLVRDQSAKYLFPSIDPINYETAVRLALKRIDEGDIKALWSDALAGSQRDINSVHFTLEQGMLIERRRKTVPVPPSAVFQAFSSLGADRGWPPHNLLWHIRKVMARLLRGGDIWRGRHHPSNLRQVDEKDFWRLELAQPNLLIRLRAEMNLPGQAWLQFEACERDDGCTDLVQISYFAPKGLAGLLYWYGLYPLLQVIFTRTIDTISQRAVEITQTSASFPEQ